MLLDSLLAWETIEFLVPVLDLSRNLVADPKRRNDCLVSIRILFVEVVQKTTALVDQGDESASGRKVLGMELQVGSQVVDALGHAGNLVFRTASISLVSSMFETKGGNASRRCVPRWRLAIVGDAILVVFGFQIADVDNVVFRRDGIILSGYFVNVGKSDEQRGLLSRQLSGLTSKTSRRANDE